MKFPNQLMSTYPITPYADREIIFNPKHPFCPFSEYVGNEAAVRLAIRIAKKAFDSYANIGTQENPVWCCSRDNPVRMLLTGPRSVGKTTYARCYADLVGTNYETGEMTMPFVEIDGTSITKREQILHRMQQAMRECNVPMVPERVVGSASYYALPPMILFIDEVHCLPSKVMEGMLKMTEPNDGIFEVGGAKIDCRRIAIIFATTNPGNLPAPLKSRFPIKIALVPHTLEELGTIIQNATDWDREDAMKMARMKPIPREALEIAKLVEATKESENCAVSHAMDLIATDLGLEEGCLTQRAIDVLLALADAQPNGLSKKNLCACCENMDESEFEQDIVPQLLKNQFHPALITVSSRHKITEAGLQELRSRNLIDY